MCSSECKDIVLTKQPRAITQKRKNDESKEHKSAGHCLRSLIL